MSLFSKPNGSVNGTATSAPTASLFGGLKTVQAPPAEYEAAKAAEKTKLAQEDTIVTMGACACGTLMNRDNTSKLRTGAIVHVGCPLTSVLPPDVPKVTHATSAVAMSAEQIAKVEDSEIRQRATEHAAIAAQVAPAVAEKAGGRCSQGGQRVLMNEKQKMSRSMTCTCGKEYKKVKDDQLDIQDTGVFWVVPTHNLPKIEVAQVAAPVTIPQTTVRAPDEPIQTAPQAAPAAPQTIFPVSARPLSQNSDLPVFPLYDYYLPLVRELEANAGAADIRCAPNDSELAYGKWKGALAAVVRAKPPIPGIYLARSDDEVAQEVINTLTPMCKPCDIMLFIDVVVERGGAVVRGVR